ncbi:MAG: T9SS type A sorting domain-containing protein [candidate division KSB1 bacterium]|nr:T9SS type A sorting domain-containing protein [candidate division KSB1 bacterium]
MKARATFEISFFLLIAVLWLAVPAVHSQLLFEENFNYPDGAKLTDYGWVAHSSGGTNPITVTSPGLTYTNYPSTSGNAALLDNTGEDVNRNFSEQTSGTLYVSFLVKVGKMPASDYFFHLGPTNLGTTYIAKLWAKTDESGNIEFSVTKRSNTPANYTDNNYSKNTTYLLVVKYEFVSGSSNDLLSLFVFADPDLPGTEPAAATLGPIDESSQSDPSNLGTIALRQFDASQNIQIDGIRIGLSWRDAPVQVELTRFSATVLDQHVRLIWSTATETENLGFHLFRSIVPEQDYQQITTELIKGRGNSNQEHSYSFIDCDVQAGQTYYYKLADVDYSGNMRFHGPISVTVEAKPSGYSLSQNYPNPFNPETAINFSLKEAGRVTLTIYNLQGQLVRTLVDEEKLAGSYSVMWDGKSDNGTLVGSGIYYYKLRANGFKATKKLMLAR